MSMDLGTISYSVNVNTGDLERADAVTAQYSESARQGAAATDRLSLATSKLTRATEGVTSRYAQLRTQIDPTYAAQQRFTRGVKILDAELKQGNISLSRYSADMARLRRSTATAGRGLRMGGNSAGSFTAAIQQAGFQVGDFAVQVGSGQSAMVAFAQQGSQLAGIFGPAGAIIGAVIAIGGAIGGGLVRSMGEGAGATKTLREETQDLTEELNKATEAQARYVRGQFAQDQERQRSVIADQRRELEILNVRMERFIEQNLAVGVPLDKIKKNGAYRSLEEEAELAQLRIDNATSSIEQSEEKLAEYEDAISGANEEEKNRQKTLDSLVATSKEQAATLDLTARETAIYKAETLGANAAELQAINNAYDRIEAFEKETAARKALMEITRISKADDPLLGRVAADSRAEKVMEEMRKESDAVEMGLDKQLRIEAEHNRRVEALKAGYRTGAIDSEQRLNELIVLSAKERNEKLAQIESSRLTLLSETQQSALSAVGNALGNFAQIAKEGGEESFKQWKFFASAQAAVSTALAVANALATPPAPLGIALAGSIAALGAVQIAKIQSQEYQGARRYGGQIQPGKNILVGEDGPEVLRMGGGTPGYVTPNHKMGGGDINQNLVFQLPVDARQEAKRVVAEAAPMMKNLARQAVLEASSMGGPMSRAMGRRR